MNDFNPLEVLKPNLVKNLDEISKRKISLVITRKFWEYLIIKLSDSLEKSMLDEIFNTTNNQQKYRILKKCISNLDQEIAFYWGEFKKEYLSYE